MLPGRCKAATAHLGCGFSLQKGVIFRVPGVVLPRWGLQGSFQQARSTGLLDVGTQALTSHPHPSTPLAVQPRAWLSLVRAGPEEEREEQRDKSRRGLQGGTWGRNSAWLSLSVAAPGSPKIESPPQPRVHCPWGALTPPAAGKGCSSRGKGHCPREGPFRAVAAGLRVGELSSARKLLGTVGGGAGPAETGPLEERRPGRGVGEQHRQTEKDTHRDREKQTPRLRETQ